MKSVEWNVGWLESTDLALTEQVHKAGEMSLAGAPNLNILNN